MDEQAYIANLTKTKDERRVKLAALPVHEKIEIMIEMQKAVAPILRQKGRNVRIWDSESE